VADTGEIIYCEGFGDDGYCSDLGALLDELEDMEEDQARPKYAWACQSRRFVNVDFDTVVESFQDEAYEDFDSSSLNGVDEFKAAIEAFNEANKGHVAWQPDYTRAILIPAEPDPSTHLRQILEEFTA